MPADHAAEFYVLYIFTTKATAPTFNRLWVTYIDSILWNMCATRRIATLHRDLSKSHVKLAVLSAAATVCDRMLICHDVRPSIVSDPEPGGLRATRIDGLQVCTSPDKKLYCVSLAFVSSHLQRCRAETAPGSFQIYNFILQDRLDDRRQAIGGGVM